MLIQNPDAIQAIREAAKLTFAEGAPANLSPTVQPVMDMTPRFHRKGVIALSSTGGSGTATLYTGTAGKQLVITSFLIAYDKDAACDTATGIVAISITQGGVSRTLGCLPIITATAEKESINVTLPTPIFCDEATNVSLASNTFTAGVLRRVVAVYGYEISTQ